MVLTGVGNALMREGIVLCVMGSRGERFEAIREMVIL
jgi:hypothetical protein